MKHRNPKTEGFLPIRCSHLRCSNSVPQERRSHGTIAPGTLACTAAGGLIVDVEAERYRIAPEDVRSLIFSGRPAPVMRERVRRTTSIVTGDERLAEGCDGRNVRSLRSHQASGQELEKPRGFRATIEGHAVVNPAGRAVAIQTRAGSWIVPLVSFRRVARGEAASAPLFPLSWR
jgi:hypothetical protein